MKEDIEEELVNCNNQSIINITGVVIIVASIDFISFAPMSRATIV
jgi:hypothetical protein